MTKSAAQRKAAERQRKKEQGLTQKTVWLTYKSIQKLDKIKAEDNCTDDEAINKALN